MSKTYKSLLDKAQTLQDEIRKLKSEAGTDTEKRLELEQCYSAFGHAIKSLVILGCIYQNDEPGND